MLVKFNIFLSICFASSFGNLSSIFVELKKQKLKKKDIVQKLYKTVVDNISVYCNLQVYLTTGTHTFLETINNNTITYFNQDEWSNFTFTTTSSQLIVCWLWTGSIVQYKWLRCNFLDFFGELVKTRFDFYMGIVRENVFCRCGCACNIISKSNERILQIMDNNKSLACLCIFSVKILYLPIVQPIYAYALPVPTIMTWNSLFVCSFSFLPLRYLLDITLNKKMNPKINITSLVLILTFVWHTIR